jgi:hypothetical protein
MLQDLNDHVQFIISAVIIAIVGGIANWLMSDEHGFLQFIVAVFLAGFAGFLTGRLCIDSNISASWSFFFCGAAGLSAEVVLKIARKTIISKLGALTGQDVSKEIDSIDVVFNQTILKDRNIKEVSKNASTPLKKFMKDEDK